MTSRHWSPGIGDPTIAGWMIMAAYFTVALLCFATAQGVRPRERRWWLALAVALLLLGINKQIDLQMLAVDFARDNAVAHGWYGQRQHYQRLFVGAMVAGGLMAAIMLTRGVGARGGGAMRASIVGICLLGGFVIIRAASLNHIDGMLGQRFAGVRFNTVMELAPLLVIAAAALGARRGRRGAR